MHDGSALVSSDAFESSTALRKRRTFKLIQSAFESPVAQCRYKPISDTNIPDPCRTRARRVRKMILSESLHSARSKRDRYNDIHYFPYPTPAFSLLGPFACMIHRSLPRPCNLAAATAGRAVVMISMISAPDSVQIRGGGPPRPGTRTDLFSAVTH